MRKWKGSTKSGFGLISVAAAVYGRNGLSRMVVTGTHRTVNRTVPCSLALATVRTRIRVCHTYPLYYGYGAHP
ncbi:uncharacterized protein EV420DRAFT_1572133 [Desarmillaria tabescens]|uniref:Uncharacterized protein n=1 Tax=Armillaria tabescens TaxID=1929756 RepID=A0AA39MTX3_ARMTA|nr:uncharacterized protein EV420DRAFT_1572133 [Desarmillaria tabescens]KAK0445670.1 hypothetical protein EV420DRAFT_1572133 [Desarmillaria tabescens]